ncbi:MAG: flagellar biosynthetic protein FliO [Armatimonadota bacterium]
MRPSSSASQEGNIQQGARGENGLRRALGIAGSVAGLLARLALVLALAYLSIVALKFLYSRTGRPLKFGERLLQVEESAPLGGGAAVHLVRIGEQRWLVGTAQGQVNILSEVGGKGEAVGAPPSREDAPSLSGLLNPGLLRELTGKASRKTDVRLEAASPARAVSGELRQTSSFIDEMRARLQAGRSS